MLLHVSDQATSCAEAASLSLMLFSTYWTSSLPVEVIAMQISIVYVFVLSVDILSFMFCVTELISVYWRSEFLAFLNIWSTLADTLLFKYVLSPVKMTSERFQRASHHLLLCFRDEPIDCEKSMFCTAVRGQHVQLFSVLGSSKKHKTALCLHSALFPV